MSEPMFEYRFAELPTKHLVERSRNPNRMTEEQFGLLVTAMRTTGRCLQPLLVRVDESMLDPRLTDEQLRTAIVLGPPVEVIDGAHRNRAAHQLGWPTIPCILIATDEAEAAALQLGMNRMRGEVSLDLATTELQLLVDACNIDNLALTGFASDEIEALLAAVKTQNVDEVLAGANTDAPDVDDEPEAKGDIVLEIKGWLDAKELRGVKRTLRKAGGGDMRRGLIKLLGEELPPRRRAKETHG